MPNDKKYILYYLTIVNFPKCLLGTLEAAAIVEHIMEHIAVVVNKDPLEVKLNNTIPGKYPIADMISYTKVQSDYEARLKAVISYNKVSISTEDT